MFVIFSWVLICRRKKFEEVRFGLGRDSVTVELLFVESYLGRVRIRISFGFFLGFLDVFGRLKFR